MRKPKKLIGYFHDKYIIWRSYKAYGEFEQEWKFIWGLQSSYDISGCEVGHWSMNDIDITYNVKTQKYHLSIETLLHFEDCINSSKEYVRSLFDSLTYWMRENNYNTDRQLALHNIFTDYLIGFRDGFDSIEELYASFKVLIEGYCDSSCKSRCK